MSLQFDPELAEALAYDPIAEAEKLVGKSYKDEEAGDGVAALGFLMMRRQREKTDALLLLNDDTNSFTQSFEEFTGVVRRLGFELVLEDEFQSQEWNPGDPTHTEKYTVWWRDGLLLTVESYSGFKQIGVNSAKFYGFWKADGEREDVWDVMHGCSGGLVKGWQEGEPYVMNLSFDCREGLRNKLAQLEAVGSFLSEWPEKPFLWLLTYMDSKAEGYDYRAITAERISRLPEHVRKAITPTENNE